ncbi:MAG: ATP-binding protein [Anaerolineae bacterium]|jgi:signal transduction histidine kinase
MSIATISRLLDVPSTDPDDARRRKLLNILLMGMAALSLLTFVAAIVVGTAHAKYLFFISPAMLIGIAGILAINRYASGLLASSLFVLVFTVGISFADEPQQVVNGRSLFLFTIPILMASVLLRPWAGFIAAGLSSSMVSVIALTLPGYVPPVPTMLGFFAFALVSWLSARSLETALRDLRALNRELDERVATRTLELQQANEELGEANERLRELDRMKSRFVSIVSHELRTPLGAIQGFAEMLQAGIYGALSAKQEDGLRRIEKNTRKLLNIVNDLLDQARIEAGELSLHPVPFSPAYLVQDLWSTIGVLAEKKGLALTTEVAEDVPNSLHGDVERLHQVLVNLVNNAIKFTHEGGVHVRIRGPDGDYASHWAMEISDTGPGIPEKDQELVFSPFRRVDDSVTREHTGVGLGLSIVKQLVELMDGEIMLESALGHGSTFTVVFPLNEADNWPKRRDL